MQTTTRRSLIAGAIAAGGLATLRGDELDPLFAAPPSGQAQPMTYRQGTVVAWDRNTLANVIDVGGSLFTNLPVNGVAESQTLTPGAHVGIMCVGEKSDTWAIIGRSVIPGTAEAADAVSLLSSQIRSSFVYPSGEMTNSITFTDLATLGPQVAIDVGPSGRILIIATAQIQYIYANAANVTGSGLFDVEFAGANARTPVAATDPLLGDLSTNIAVSAGNVTGYEVMTITAQACFEGLNPGSTTVTMKYRKLAAGDPVADFHRRNLTVIRL